MPENRQFLLSSRPTGEPTVDNFKLVTSTTPPLQDGEVLLRHHYLSLDPYMRGRMNEAEGYAASQPLNQVMLGATIGEVVESKSADLKEGAFVVNYGGWQEYTVVPAAGVSALQVIDTSRGVPLSAYLGPVGMPGVTAWYGLLKICMPKSGETVVVSAASGAVGSVVGQLAKAHGCRVVGFAGGPKKCKYVEEELGFDNCIDYKAHGDIASLERALKEAAPSGVDCNFENVGGMVMNAVFNCMNAFGRVAVCGMIAGYNGEPVPLENPTTILWKRLLVKGFICSEHMEHWPAALKELADLVASGKLKYQETIAQGLESAPEAFLGMLKGKNFGKQLVKLV